MALHQEDMSLVPEPNAIPEEGWYQVRVSGTEEGVSESSGGPVVKLSLKIQNECPYTGRFLPIAPVSLQPHALFNLKAWYSAVGYKPAPGQGHDPDNIRDGECWVFYEHKVVDGTTRGEIKPYNIKSLQDGPGKAKK